MPDQIPEAVKKERSQMLIELGRKHQQEFMETFLGEKKEVLFEEQQEIDGKLYWTGHTMEYLKVAMFVRGKSEQSAFAGKFNRNSPGRSSVGM